MDWLQINQPDVLCLQETKQEDHKFPYADLQAIGYQAVHIGQKTYNGVAIISRHAMTDIQHNIPQFADDQQRVIAATIAGKRVVCAYIPNGQAVDSDKYQYKLRWLTALNGWLKNELSLHPNLLLLGDYNIAPEDRDCHDPSAWLGQVLVSPAERAAFQALLDLGLHDSFRLFEQADKSFSWWDYRMMGFRRNAGVRIDHVLLTNALKEECIASRIDKVPRGWEQPSDHAPVITTLG